MLLRMTRAEIAKQCSRRGFLIFLVALMIFSALFPLFVGKNLQVQSGLKEHYEFMYENMKTNMDLFDTSKLTSTQKEILDFTRKKSNEVIEKRINQPELDYGIDYKDFYLSKTMLDDLEFTNGVYEINKGEMSETELSDFMQQLVQGNIMWSLNFHSKDEKLGGRYEQLQEAKAIFDSGISYKEIALKHINFLKQRVEDITQAIKEGTTYIKMPTGLFGVDQGTLNDYQKKLEMAQLQYRYEAFEPGSWKSTAFNQYISSPMFYIDMLAQREFSGMFEFEDTKGKTVLIDPETQTEEEIEKTTNYLVSDQQTKIGMGEFLFQHSIIPMDCVKEGQNTRIQLLNFLPFLLVVAIAAAVFTAVSAAREFKRKTVTGLLTLPVSRSKLAASQLCAVGVIGTGLVLACVLCNLVSTGFVFGWGDILQSEVFLLCGKPHGVWFVFAYLWQVVQQLCVVWLGMLAAYVASFGLRRAIPGIAAAIIVPLAGLIRAAYPHISALWRDYQAMNVGISAADSRAPMVWDLSGIYRAAVENLQLGLWVFLVLILIAALVLIGIKLFQRVWISK